MSDTFVRISNWDDDEYNYLYKYEKSEKCEKMLNTRLNAHGGFTPAAVASPTCDTSRTGNTTPGQDSSFPEQVTITEQ